MIRLGFTCRTPEAAAPPRALTPLQNASSLLGGPAPLEL